MSAAAPGYPTTERTVPRWLYGYGVVLMLFLLAPMIIVVVISFNSEAVLRFPPRGFTLQWFVNAFTYPTFLRAIAVSIALGAMATLSSLLIGVPAALAISRGGRWSMAIETYLLAPLGFPMIVLGVALLFYNAAVGLGLSAVGLACGHVVITLPYVVRSVVSVHRGTDPGIEEAAATLGAAPLQRFRCVTLPLIRPGILSGALFAFLISFDNVPISIFLTDHNTTTIPVAVLSYLVYSFDPAIAALYTAKMLLVLLVVVFMGRRTGTNLVGIGTLGPRV